MLSRKSLEAKVIVDYIRVGRSHISFMKHNSVQASHKSSDIRQNVWDIMIRYRILDKLNPSILRNHLYSDLRKN